MEVMPLFAGHLPLPDVRLFKYLPHHSAHASQLDAGKEFTEGRSVLPKVGHVLISRPMLKVLKVNSLCRSTEHQYSLGFSLVRDC